MEWAGYTEKEYKQVLNLKKRIGIDDIVRITGIPKPTVSKWIYLGVKPFFIPEKALTEYQRGFLEALIDGEGFPAVS